MWLQLRRRIIPWCLRPGCWEESMSSFGRGRGNVCPGHFMAALMAEVEDEP